MEFNLFSAPSSFENGSGGGGYIIRDNFCRRLLLAVPLVDQQLWETGFYYLLIFRCGGLFLTRRGTIDSRSQRITCLTLGNDNGNNGHDTGSHHQ